MTGCCGVARPGAVLLLVFFAAALASAAVEAQAGGGRSVDCNYLYYMISEALRGVAEGAPNTQLISLMANVSLPGSLGEQHERVYSLLYELAVLEEAVGEGRLPGDYLEALTLIYRGFTDLPGLVAAYTRSLSQCSTDKTLSTILGVEVGKEMRRLRVTLYGLEEEVFKSAYPRAEANTSVELRTRIIRPSNPVLSLCLKGLGDGEYTVEVLATPGHAPIYTTLFRASVEAVNGTLCASWTGVQELLESTPPPVLYYPQTRALVPLWLVVKITGANGSLVYGPSVARTDIEYLSPIKRLWVPGTLRHGEDMVVEVEPRVPVNVTVYIDRRLVAVEALESKGAVVVPSSSIEIGYHSVIVEAQAVKGAGLYPKAFYSKAVAVLAPSPGAEIVFSNPAVTLDNTVPVKIMLRTTQPVLVEARTPMATVRETVESNETLRLPVPPMPLPWSYTVEITVYYPNSTVKAASYEYSVLVINPLGIVVVAFPILALLLRYDQLDLLRLIASTRPRHRAAPRPPGFTAYYEALRMRFKPSRKARDYYGALRRLGAPLPLPPETLREHWARIRAWASRAPGLEKLMREAEEDLYRG